MLNLEKSEFLSDAQIREKAPCVFSKKASAEVSKHYTHIPTSKVINDMRTLGWDVVDAKEVKARKNSTKGFQKHLVVFRNPDVQIDVVCVLPADLGPVISGSRTLDWGEMY